MEDGGQLTEMEKLITVGGAGWRWGDCFISVILNSMCLRNVHQEICCGVLKFRETATKCMIKDTCLGL